MKAFLKSDDVCTLSIIFDNNKYFVVIFIFYFVILIRLTDEVRGETWLSYKPDEYGG
jgi:hypothetical protein